MTTSRSTLLRISVFDREFRGVYNDANEASSGFLEPVELPQFAAPSLGCIEMMHPYFIFSLIYADYD